MYTVRSNQDATAPTRVGEKPQANNWQAGTVQQVDSSLIRYFQEHADVFTILASDGALTTGVEVLTGLSAINVSQSVIQQVTFNLVDVAITVTDALAYASKKIFTFPEGRILLLGAIASLKWAVTTDRTATSGTINDSASLTWALGSVAASNITLSSTMVDMLPKLTKVLDGAAAAYTATASTGALASNAQFDGTTTAVPVYLNVGFETNTDIDHDGILNCKGSIVLTYLNLGDY
jgi:hypothetical protein